jgi:hypothetical protein
MKLRLVLTGTSNENNPYRANLPQYNNLHADYERGLALVDIPVGMYPEFLQEYAHPEEAAIDEGAIRHLTTPQKRQLKAVDGGSLSIQTGIREIELG